MQLVSAGALMVQLDNAKRSLLRLRRCAIIVRLHNAKTWLLQFGWGFVMVQQHKPNFAVLL